MWKEIGPYAVPLAVLALILWRGIKAKPRKVSLRRIWIRPVVAIVAIGAVLTTAPLPGPLAIAGMGAGLMAGLGAGWLRARHMAFTVDSETGTLTSTATPIGTILVVVLFAARFLLKLAFPQMAHVNTGHHISANALLWTDIGLLFSAGMVWGRAITMWLRARPLLEAHRAGSVGGAE